ncbi:MAG: hypothetical protein WA958_04835 [Tunicatimonas sp.]
MNGVTRQPIKTIKRIITAGLLMVGLRGYASDKSRPIVNQSGYNLCEGKRFVCYGAEDGTPFSIIWAKDSTNEDAKSQYSGVIENFAGDFTDFNPITTEEFVVSVPDYGVSHPFWIADHLIEGLSSRLAYEHFIDVRGSEDSKVSPASITGGGPSRDGGGQTLEALYEVLLYASNPALFNQWTTELRGMQTPDLIDLILWHAEFCYNNIDYKGGSSSHLQIYEFDYAERVRYFGFEDGEKQQFDRQNMLDQLAAVCAAYRPFLHPYLDEETFRKYRKACLDRWERYDRHQEVRYWTYSMKWIDEGYREFNEQGNAFGQGLLRNTMMYLCENNEPDGQPQKFLNYAHACATDIVDNWDLNSPWHTWALRNAEHITPQALAFYQLSVPDHPTEGVKEKLTDYRDYVYARTDNFWQYRKHSEEEWAHPKSKEVGTVSGLGGSFFAVAAVLDDPKLRAIGWSQVNFVFGLNPNEAHLSHRDSIREARNGYWKGVEEDWPFEEPRGTGMLGGVRGTLDGSPADGGFPYNPEHLYGGELDHYFHTEGWAISNRAWMSSIVFSTLGSHELRVMNQDRSLADTLNYGDVVTIELKAALNLNWNQRESGTVTVQVDEQAPFAVQVLETGENTGLFTGTLQLNYPQKTRVRISYGHFGFAKSTSLYMRKLQDQPDLQMF